MRTGQKKETAEFKTRESSANLAVQEWTHFDAKVRNALKKVNAPNKRKGLARSFRKNVQALRLLEPVLSLDRRLPVLEVRRAGEPNFERITIQQLLITPLESLADYVENIRAKKGNRGDALIAQLLDQ